uniref:Pre-mRNA-splicing factor SPF27 n=2 Tax=Meloidogyne javanica TaxID=6303 RepID=A0A915MAV0_MELJA
MFINLRADFILRTLRRPGEKCYKIPHGGMFKYVSCANFLGEIIEWIGYAIYAQSTASLAFALFTAANTIPRAKLHHKWYLNKFGNNYPQDRKAVIPMLPICQDKGEGNEVFLDALPYIDDINYTEEHKQLALKLIEAEMRRFPMTKNYLRNFPEPDYDKFLTQRLIEHQQQIANKQEIPKLDLLRYEVPTPGRAANKKAWLSAIDNCKAQLSNQNLRKINLELLLEYGSEAHLRSNEILKSQVESSEAELYKIRSELYELNARRKRSQMQAGEELTSLGQGWVELVTKNAGMEIAIDALEKEIKTIAKRLKVDPGLVEKESK